MENNKIPLRRSPIILNGTLSKLFKSEKDWEDIFAKAQNIPDQFASFKGT